MLSFLALANAVAWSRRTLSAVVRAGLAGFSFFIFTDFVSADRGADPAVHFTGGAVLCGVTDPISTAGPTTIVWAGFAGFFLVANIVSTAGTAVRLAGSAGFAFIGFADIVSADHRAFAAVIWTGRAALIVVAALVPAEGFDTSFRTIF